MIDYYGCELSVGDTVKFYYWEESEAVSTIKSISEGGTVTLKSALEGRRCFAGGELVLIQKGKVIK